MKNHTMRIRKLMVLLLTTCLAACSESNTEQTAATKQKELSIDRPAGRWTTERIDQWAVDHGWLVGNNYVPANAINQLEMWQGNTFSPKLIDKELGWAEDLGFNTLRVFLHYLPWKEDKAGFYRRVDQFLDICDQHSIKVMFIFFDDVWDPNPIPGIQPEPVRGVHNSGWVQCPGKEILRDLDAHDQLKPYVQETMQRYAEDQRVLIWDIYNEPANPNVASYRVAELENKEQYSLALLQKSFQWAREINPSQPICSGIWTAIGHTDIDQLSPVDKFCYENSDLINFHAYSNLTGTEQLVKLLQTAGRPLVCTEYMARTANSTFQDILPLFREHQVAAYNWGFVHGKSNTIFPWESWEKPYENEPDVWFHDIFRSDGTPYSQEEVDLIKSLTKK